MSALQPSWTPAHHRSVAASVDLNLSARLLGEPMSAIGP
jgi:hypothetical protein